MRSTACSWPWDGGQSGISCTNRLQLRELRLPRRPPRLAPRSVRSRAARSPPRAYALEPASTDPAASTHAHPGMVLRLDKYKYYWLLKLLRFYQYLHNCRPEKSAGMDVQSQSPLISSLSSKNL